MVEIGQDGELNFKWKRAELWIGAHYGKCCLVQASVVDLGCVDSTVQGILL